MASGLHGKPAFRKAHPSSVLRDTNQGSPSLYANSLTLVYFFSGIFDGTKDNGEFISLLNNNALLQANNATEIQYEDDENGNPAIIAGEYNLNNLTMAAVSISDPSSAFVKINNLAGTTFNPANSYSTLGSFRAGSRSPLGYGLHHEIYGIILYDRGLSDAELNQLYMWGLARYT